MKYQVISQTEFEVTVKLASGKLFTVYSSQGRPLDLLLSLIYPEAMKRVNPEVKLVQVFERSLEETNVTFKGVA